MLTLALRDRTHLIETLARLLCVRLSESAGHINAPDSVRPSCCRFRGVSRKKLKWEAKVMVQRKWAYRELFATEEAAGRACSLDQCACFLSRPLHILPAQPPPAWYFAPGRENCRKAPAQTEPYRLTKCDVVH